MLLSIQTRSQLHLVGSKAVYLSKAGVSSVLDTMTLGMIPHFVSHTCIDVCCKHCHRCACTYLYVISNGASICTITEASKLVSVCVCVCVSVSLC